MSSPPPIGLRHTGKILVTPESTVPGLAAAIPAFQAMPPVFATAYLVAFAEATCAEAVLPFLAQEQRTVGTHVDLSHIAATPVGMTVWAEVELVEADRRRLRFEVECRDEVEAIGRGVHERAIIDLDRFMERLGAKQR